MNLYKFTDKHQENIIVKAQTRRAAWSKLAAYFGVSVRDVQQVVQSVELLEKRTLYTALNRCVERI